MRALEPLPSRMNAGIAADEMPVVPVKPMRIAGSWRELRRHHQLAGLPIIFIEPGFAFPVTGAVVAGDDPDVLLIVETDVVETRLLFRARADQDFRNPRLRIDAQNAAQSQRGNPQLAVVPFDAVAAAAAAVDAQRNLPMSDQLRVHVDLKDSERLGVRPHPDAAAAVRHPRGIAR